MVQGSPSAAREKSPSGFRSGAGAGAASSPDQTGPGSNMPPAGLKQTVSRNSAARSHSGSTARSPKWWKVSLFKGIIGDLRRRAPYYWSDWKDAWDYRVVPATVYMYFAKYDAPLFLVAKKNHRISQLPDFATCCSLTFIQTSFCPLKH
jgi:hypothetical protein